MNRYRKFAALGLLAVGGLLGTGLTQARSNVYFSVDIGVPVAYPQVVYGVPPPPVYAPPPAVVYVPPPVFEVPRPVYLRPQPVYLYGPAAYYYRGKPWKHHRHERWHDGD